MRMFGCSGNLSAIDKYNVGNLTAHVALPMYEMPVFGFYKTAILSLEKDKLIKGNILAVQGWSVVSYSPGGEVDYILTVENDPYHKTAGGMQVNDDAVLEINVQKCQHALVAVVVTSCEICVAL